MCNTGGAEMSKLIEIALDENTKIYLEASDIDVGGNESDIFAPASAGDGIIKRAKNYLDEQFQQIKAFSSSIAESIKSIDASPDEFEVEFAVKFAVEGGVIISSVSSEASITIKLKWSKTKNE